MNRYRVERKWLSSSTNTTITVAGNGSYGSGPHMLNLPRGIFVDLNFTLYVADSFNFRIQRFWLGDTNGTPVAGAGAPSTITLMLPTGVVLDADGYLFIVDGVGNRIVGSGPNGFRCIAGCSFGFGSAMNQLLAPSAFTFDIDGNIYVADTYNHRIQKFILDINSCGTYIPIL
jgi:sugar lactone lactonase YvrE